jgi:hypothetical protein
MNEVGFLQYPTPMAGYCENSGTWILLARDIDKGTWTAMAGYEVMILVTRRCRIMGT